MEIFFIIGTGRCGTNMLTDMLNLHPDIKVIPETHFIPTLYDKYGLAQIEFDDFFKVVDNIYSARGNKWINVILKRAGKDERGIKQDLKKYIQKNGIKGNIKDYLESFYSYLYGEGVCVIGDKSPHYGTVLNDVIYKIWPNAKVIHITREPFATAKSMMGHVGFRKHIINNTPPNMLDRIMYGKEYRNILDDNISINQALLFWQKVYLNILQNIQNKESREVLTLKYEDLLMFTKEVLAKTAGFLGVSVGKHWLASASRIPHPFPEKKIYNNVINGLMLKYRDVLSEEICKTNHDYSKNIKRSWLNCIQEIWRGRSYYFSQYNPLSLTKNVLRMVLK